MLFSSTEFIFFFLPIVLAGYAIIGRFYPGMLSLLWLAGLSLFFYAYWNPPYLAILVVSICVNYLVGRALLKRRSRGVLTVGIVFNLALIAYFKYTVFGIVTLNWAGGLNLAVPEIVLPLAISFFTFQKIAYLVDIYRGRIVQVTPLNYIVFVTFFPQLIAGPIVHYTELVPQFENRSSWALRWEDLAAGSAIFIIGLQKKLVLADGIAVYANGFFLNLNGGVPGMIDAWIGALAFTFQIYFDFSGYTDMAIGLARMFGIRLPENFDSPYKSVSIIDFWRRWHMTLSRFLRDYLYIPLGGNRDGAPRRYINIMLTMVLGGLWHGAAWTFVFWGALHGAYIVINHAWRALRVRMGHDLSRSSRVGRAAARCLTLLAVIVAWVFFRAQSWTDAWTVLSGMAGFHGGFAPQGDQFQTLVILFFLAFFVFVLPNTRQLMESMKADWTLTPLRISVTPALIVAGWVALMIVIAKGSATADFIYMVF